jgi:hypothetical protein
MIVLAGNWHCLEIGGFLPCVAVKVLCLGARK